MNDDVLQHLVLGQRVHVRGDFYGWEGVYKGPSGNGALLFGERIPLVFVENERGFTQEVLVTDLRHADGGLVI